MIKLDLSVVVQIINFVFLIVVLNIILFKPVREILRQRKEKVNGLEEGIEMYNQEAREKDQSYLSGLKEARLKGLKEKENLLESASEEEKMIILRINEKAKAELEAVRQKIAQDVESVRGSLQGDIDSFAEAIRQKIMGRAV